MTTARRWLSLGEPLLAHDVISEARQIWTNNTELNTVAGLALARCGAKHAACDLLTGLYHRGIRDEETIGILARIHKDLWIQDPNSNSSLRHLERSSALYLEAYTLTGKYWTGINAASTTLFKGNDTEAKRIAKKVRDACQTQLQSLDSSVNDYWLLATIGEASLILGELDEAEGYYIRAFKLGGRDHGNLATTRRNAKLIAQTLNLNHELLEHWLPAPNIAIATGHMIDLPDRQGTYKRFPTQNENAVKELFRHYIQTTGVTIAYASAACGSDLLFLEAILESGGEIHVVLPQSIDHFVRVSVEIGGVHWTKRFRRVIEQASTLTIASEDSNGDISFAYVNVLIYGAAKARAQQLDGRIHALALWDGKEGPMGGTATAVKSWQATGQDVTVISPLTFIQRIDSGESSFRGAMNTLPRASAVAAGIVESQIVAILFADAVGFSKLQDKQIPIFVKFFLGAIIEVAAAQSDAPLVRNTWGDGLFFIFADPPASAAFALSLRDRITKTDWPNLGLPADLDLRIALHCGPAFAIFDPVIQQASYTGSHVSRAARMEPVTPPGEIYVSAAFAAVSEAMRVTDYKCEYVGQMPLAKKYGQFPIYRLDWSTKYSTTHQEASNM